MEDPRHRVVVDLERCELNGLCLLEAPAVFAITGPTGSEQLDVLEPEPQGDEVARAEAAAAACPTGAISMVEVPA